MSRRRIEMHQYRQVLVRIRHGDSDRELARCRYMGRRKLAALRELAEQRGWLKPDAPLPDDAEIAAALGSPRKATSTVSGLEVHRALIASWLEQNVPGAYFGERDRRFRERDRFGWLGRCAVSIVDFLVSSGRVRAPGRWVWGMSF